MGTVVSPTITIGKTHVPIQNDFFVTRSMNSRRTIIRTLCIADPLEDGDVRAPDLLDEDVVERRGDDLELRHPETPGHRAQDRLRIGPGLQPDLGVRAVGV